MSLEKAALSMPGGGVHLANRCKAAYAVPAQTSTAMLTRLAYVSNQGRSVLNRAICARISARRSPVENVVNSSRN